MGEQTIVTVIYTISTNISAIISSYNHRRMKMSSTSEEVPLSQTSLSTVPFNEQKLTFNDQQLLEFYEHSLARAFQQVRMIVIVVGLTM